LITAVRKGKRKKKSLEDTIGKVLLNSGFRAIYQLILANDELLVCSPLINAILRLSGAIGGWKGLATLRSQGTPAPDLLYLPLKSYRFLAAFFSLSNPVP
jgi:hypothetical protein